MAQYVKIPKDIKEIKETFIWIFTKRQAICIAVAAVLGLPVFWIMHSMGYAIDKCTFGLFLVGAIPILCGVFDHSGYKFEQYAKIMINFYKHPKQKTYKNSNKYLEMQEEKELKELQETLKRGTVIKYVKVGKKPKKEKGRTSAKQSRKRANQKENCTNQPV